MPATAYEPIAAQLSIGLQLLGKALEEARILQIAHAYEQSTEWHKALPKL
jgi:aspartyl-tRNA(Asn)/glutamyl-tRNA(Gln) amidotransferase subunit A